MGIILSPKRQFQLCFWFVLCLYVKRCRATSTRSLLPLTIRYTPVGIGIQSALLDGRNKRRYCNASRHLVAVKRASIKSTASSSSSSSPPYIFHFRRQRQQQQQQEPETQSEEVECQDPQIESTQLINNSGTTGYSGKSTKKSFRFRRDRLLNINSCVDTVNSNIINASSSDTTDSSATTQPRKTSRGGATAAATATAAANALPQRPLVFWESMISGAISRSVAQTVMHPANTMKTILQASRKTADVAQPTVLTLLSSPNAFKTLSRGAGANFVLSVPHGAINFAILEFVRQKLNSFVESVPSLSKRSESMGPGLDFMSSAISTICCSVVSTPQMMITDNIMAGNYPDLVQATQGLYTEQGIIGFYRGWWPGLVGKIPSYVSY